MTGAAAQTKLLVDVGNLNLKFALCEKTKKGCRVLACGSKAVDGLSQVMEEFYVPIDSMSIAFSPSFCKARLIECAMEREIPQKVIDEKEQEEILVKVQRHAKDALAKDLAKEQGILASEFFLHELAILKAEIDGSEVFRLTGQQGVSLDFLMLCMLLPRRHVDSLQSIALQYPKLSFRLVHGLQTLLHWSFLRQKSGVFLDVGHSITQISCVDRGALLFAKELPWGGEMLLRQLCRALGITEGAAHALQEEYAQGKLQDSMRKRVRDIFLPELLHLGILVRESLREYFLPSGRLFLFGGTACLGDTKEVFEKEDWNVSVLTPKDLVFAENFGQALNPLYAPLFFQYYAKE